MPSTISWFMAPAASPGAYDKLTRTQLAGIPVAGFAGCRHDRTALLWRWGWAAGAGVEFPIAPNWTAKLEYLATGFGGRPELFPGRGDSRSNSDLTMQSLRLGVNYQLGADLPKNDGLHQGRPGAGCRRFRRARPDHAGRAICRAVSRALCRPNSLAANSGRETFDLDLYVGYRPWQGGEIWVNPEIDQGFGLSGTFGVAGFPSAEAYKVGQAYPYARMPRVFLRQTIDLGGDSQKVDAGINQFAGTQTSTGW